MIEIEYATEIKKLIYELEWEKNRCKGLPSESKEIKQLRENKHKINEIFLIEFRRELSSTLSRLPNLRHTLPWEKYQDTLFTEPQGEGYNCKHA